MSGLKFPLTCLHWSLHETQDLSEIFGRYVCTSGSSWRSATWSWRGLNCWSWNTRLTWSKNVRKKALRSGQVIVITNIIILRTIRNSRFIESIHLLILVRFLKRFDLFNDLLELTGCFAIYNNAFGELLWSHRCGSHWWKHGGRWSTTSSSMWSKWDSIIGRHQTCRRWNKFPRFRRLRRSIRFRMGIKIVGLGSMGLTKILHKVGHHCHQRLNCASKIVNAGLQLQSQILQGSGSLKKITERTRLDSQAH